MNEYELIENKTGKVVGKVKIKKTIKEYATGAISCLTDQLEGVKSPKRKARILARIDEWKRVIEAVNNEQLQNLMTMENVKNEVAVQETPTEDPAPTE